MYIEKQFDLKTLNLTDGTYSITVVAKADGYLDSKPSNAVTYVIGTGEKPLPAGLYDANNNLVASWDTLVNTYGMNCETNYTSSTFDEAPSPYYVLTNTSNLSSGVKLVISDNVNHIGDYSFCNCGSLTTVIIPNSVTSIGKAALSLCMSLTKIIMGNNITSIGNSAFYLSQYLKRVDFSKHQRENAPSLGSNAFDYTDASLQIKVPASLIDDWKNATNWSDIKEKIVTSFPEEV